MPTKRAIALGFFDGIHIGHAALMRRLVEVSNETGLSPTVLSFDTLPQNFIEHKAIPLINTPEDRTLLILRSFKVHDILFLPFDEKTASMPWDSFIDKLTNEYNAGHIIAGNNFRFGKGAEGNCELLKNKCREMGIGCDIIPDVVQDGIVISSTYIRELLSEGDVEQASKFLGHPHVLTGYVRRGKRLGSKLGVPTLNMTVPAGVLVPAHGVYATRVYVTGDAHFVFFNSKSELKQYLKENLSVRRRLSRLLSGLPQCDGLPGVTTSACARLLTATEV